MTLENTRSQRGFCSGDLIVFEVGLPSFQQVSCLLVPDPRAPGSRGWDACSACLSSRSCSARAPRVAAAARCLQGCAAESGAPRRPDAIIRSSLHTVSNRLPEVEPVNPPDRARLRPCSGRRGRHWSSAPSTALPVLAPFPLGLSGGCRGRGSPLLVPLAFFSIFPLPRRTAYGRLQAREAQVLLHPHPSAPSGHPTPHSPPPRSLAQHQGALHQGTGRSISADRNGGDLDGNRLQLGARDQ